MGVRAWISQRHALRVEAALALGLYVVYEGARGLAAGSAGVAVDHARAIARAERALHVFAEPSLQRVADGVPGLVGVLGASYLTLHLAVTGAVLLWLHRRRPELFPVVRTTLLAASALSLLGFVFLPTAPPRLAGIGIADTISSGAVSLHKGLVSALYNPFAAVPSMHVGYAVVVAGALFSAGGRLHRMLALAYPPFVLLVIVATGNHFFADAAAGAAVAAVAFAVAHLTTKSPAGRTSRRQPAPQPGLAGSAMVNA